MRGSEANAHCEGSVEESEPAIIQEADFAVRGSEGGVITVLFKPKGDGTSYLKSLKIGDNIDYLAPLGNCFTLPEIGEKGSPYRGRDWDCSNTFI